MRRLPVLALGCGASLLTATAVTVSPAWAVAPGTEGLTGMHALAEATLPGLLAAVTTGQATDLGAVDPAMPMQTAVTVARPDAAGEKAFTAAVEDPAGPSYRHFLTPAQFDARFGVPAATAQGVRGWATAQGLSAVTAIGSGDYLLLSGTAAQVESTFGVALHDYSVAGKTYVANTAAPLVPAAVDGVLGLDTVHGAHPMTASGSRPAQGICTAICTGALDIEDFYTAYDMPSTSTGQGQTMAVFGEGAVTGVIGDLRQFEAEHKIPQVPITVRSVGDDFKDTLNSGEWDLDTQASTGIAYNAAGESLYFGATLLDASINATYAQWADDADGPHQANASFGECEPIPPFASLPGGGVGVGPVGVGTQSIDAFNAQEAQLAKARAEGRTLFASAGDQGGACGVGIPNAFENNGVPELNVPAGSINAVGVGGTVLYTTSATDHSRAVERALDASGGGSSTFIHADTYQTALLSNLTPPLTPVIAHQDGTPDTSMALARSLPDVAADSGDISVVAGLSGLTIVSGNDGMGTAGTDTTAAGTSLSSPLTMGMWTRIQGARGGPAGLGFANPVLYRLASTPATDTADFYDVTLGSNGQRVAMPRSALDPTGYDQITGLGVLDVSGIIASLAPAAAAPVTMTAPVTTTTTKKTTTKKKASTHRRTTVAAVSAPTGSLAATGLPAGLAALALGSTAGGLALRRRTRRRI